jgi:hypothetical protein
MEVSAKIAIMDISSGNFMATKNTHGAVNVWKNLAVEYRGK